MMSLKVTGSGVLVYWLRVSGVCFEVENLKKISIVLCVMILCHNMDTKYQYFSDILDWLHSLTEIVEGLATSTV